MLIFIHTTAATTKSRRTEVWKCANYSANKSKCDGNIDNITIVYAISHCFIQLALFERIRRTQQSKTNVALLSGAHRERRARECLLWVVEWSRRAGADNMWAAGWVVFCDNDPKAAHTYYEQRITLTHSLTRSHAHRHYALYFSPLVLVFMLPSPQQVKITESKAWARFFEARRIECHAFWLVWCVVVSLVATVTTSSSVYGTLCTSPSSLIAVSHSSSSLSIVVTVHTQRQRRRRYRPRSRRRRFFCGPHRQKKKKKKS